MQKCALISGRGMGLMHGGNFHSHPDAEVVAVCDMDPELLAKAEEQFGAPGYASIEELLANCDAELVLLIVNETRRIPPLRQLLEAGRNVFTEKPLCGLEDKIGYAKKTSELQHLLSQHGVTLISSSGLISTIGLCTISVNFMMMSPKIGWVRFGWYMPVRTSIAGRMSLIRFSGQWADRSG